MAQITSEVPSKYMLKGTAIKNLKAYVIARAGQEYFDQITMDVGLGGRNLIVASSWYPASVFIRMQQLVAAKLNMPIEEFMVDSARYVLEVDLNGVYKFFMQLSGPQAVLAKLPQMANAYGNFIHLDLLENQLGFAAAVFQVPVELAEWYFHGSVGAATGILNVCKKPLKSMKAVEKEVILKNGEQIAQWRWELFY